MICFLICTVILASLLHACIAQAGTGLSQDEFMAIKKEMNLTFPMFHRASSESFRLFVKSVIHTELGEVYRNPFFPLADFLSKFWDFSSPSMPFVTRSIFRILDQNSDGKLTFDEFYCNNQEKSFLEKAKRAKVGPFGYLNDEEVKSSSPGFELLVSCFIPYFERRYPSPFITSNLANDLFKVIDTDGNLQIDAKEIADHLSNLYSFFSIGGPGTSINGDSGGIFGKIIPFAVEEFSESFIKALSESSFSKRKLTRNHIHNDLAITQEFYDVIQNSLNDMEENDKAAGVFLRMALTQLYFHLGNSDSDIYDTFISVKELTSNIKPTLSNIEEALFNLVDQDSDGGVDVVDFQNWVHFLTQNKYSSFMNSLSCWKKLKIFENFLSKSVHPAIFSALKSIWAGLLNAPSKYDRNAAKKKVYDVTLHLAKMLLIVKYELLGGNLKYASVSDFDRFIDNDSRRRYFEDNLSLLDQKLNFYTVTNHIDLYVDKKKYPIDDSSLSSPSNSLEISVGSKVKSVPECTTGGVLDGGYIGVVERIDSDDQIKVIVSEKRDFDFYKKSHLILVG